MIYFALKNKRKTILAQKITKVKTIRITFMSSGKFESDHYKKTEDHIRVTLIENRRQRDKNILKYFWGALAEMAKKLYIQWRRGMNP